MAQRRTFGSIRRLPSPTGKPGRWQAFYNDPEGRSRLSRSGNETPLRHTAPHTFDTKMDAEAWLVDERRLISTGAWTAPEDRAEAARAAHVEAEVSRMPTFEEYARRWIDERRVKGRPLAPRTRDHYHQLLDDYLVRTFGPVALDQITPGSVNLWYDGFRPVRKKSHGSRTKGDTARAHTYSLARAIMNTAVSAHGPLVGRVNPFAVRGGGSAPVKRRDEHVATGAQLAVMLATIRPEWRSMILLATWCGLRYSEIVELRRPDLDLSAQVVKVRRSVTRSKVEGVGVKGPKSDAGLRDVHIPNHIVGDLRTHLRENITGGRDGLLFPNASGGHLAPATFYGTPGARGWYAARAAAGCPKLRFHDLRATGATLMAQLGATEAEIQAFLGDSTPAAAQRYVRAAQSRMKSLAGRMSELAKAGDW